MTVVLHCEHHYAEGDCATLSRPAHSAEEVVHLARRDGWRAADHTTTDRRGDKCPFHAGTRP